MRTCNPMMKISVIGAAASRSGLNVAPARMTAVNCSQGGVATPRRSSRQAPIAAVMPRAMRRYLVSWTKNTSATRNDSTGIANHRTKLARSGAGPAVGVRGACMAFRPCVVLGAAWPAGAAAV
jgi:hypothetical protein